MQIRQRRNNSEKQTKHNPHLHLHPFRNVSETNKQKKTLQIQKIAKGFLESCAPGREQLFVITESSGATIYGHPKVIMLGMGAFRISLSKETWLDFSNKLMPLSYSFFMAT